MSGEGERASRPSSLLLEAPPPEREPLRFDVQLVGAPPEVEQLVNSIKQVAEDFLYHWKTFPIVLPPSRFTGAGNRPSDIIVAPPCDELDAAALDAGVEPQPLSPKQLHSIREKGEFEVPSRHFPGQTHVWRVAGWLQRGRVRRREELYCHVAKALALIVVVARDRLLRDEPLSVIAGARSLLQGLHRLLDLAFGMPSLEARDLEKKIREERSRYLVAELICMPEHQEDIAALAAWVTRAMRRAAAEKAEAREPPRPPPPVPCLYTTPQHMQVDLRLYRRETVRRAAGALQALLEREARGWFLHFRERRAAHLATNKMPMQDIEQDVRDAAMREYVSRVCAAVLASEPLAALGGGVPQLLADQLRATAIVTRAEEGVRRKLEAGLATAEARLRAAQPVLARAAAWRRERLAAAAARLRAELRWAPHEDAAAAMLQHQLHQHRYFLLRDLAFLRDREPLLLKELRGAQSPTRSFLWATRTWRAARWRVERRLRGRRERVPTVLSRRATSIVTPRSDPSQPVFLVHRDTLRTTTTRWPAWRLRNLAHRTWCWTWNIMYVLGVLVPWCSPLALRALLCVKPFVPDYELSQVNGTLFPKRSSETQTMWSRLLTLWRHVSKQRTRFETEPDTGLLGKGLSRQANRVWNYGVLGGLGSAALLLLFPLASAAACAASALLALAAPLWVPPLALLLHVAAALVYDVDCPDPPRLNRWFPLLEAVVWRVGVLGALQALAALLLALVLCPLAALLLLVGGVAWWCARGAWEAAAWRGVLARGARVPAHDSRFCRRVRGPGLHQRTYYQITSGQALAAACARAAPAQRLRALRGRLLRALLRADRQDRLVQAAGEGVQRAGRVGAREGGGAAARAGAGAQRRGARARAHDLARPAARGSGVRAGAGAQLRRGGARAGLVGGARPRARRLARARRQHARRGVRRGGAGGAGGGRGAAAAGGGRGGARVGGALRPRRRAARRAGRARRLGRRHAVRRVVRVGRQRAAARGGSQPGRGRLQPARARRAPPARAAPRRRGAGAAQQGVGQPGAAGLGAVRRDTAESRGRARLRRQARGGGAVPRRGQLVGLVGLVARERRRRRAARRARRRAARRASRAHAALGTHRARRHIHLQDADARGGRPVPVDADGARRAPARRPGQPRGRDAGRRAARRHLRLDASASTCV